MIHTEDITKSADDPPLTLDELRTMTGEPVWLSGKGLDRWEVLHGISTDDLACFYQAALPLRRYGTDWSACRRRPEGRAT